MTWPATDLVVIVGPTAAGKSALAEALAERHRAALVSADALQVYRGLDIGTAKPPPEIRSRLTYHGLDLYEPVDRCTAGRYGRFARRTLEQIRERGDRAILVGGSGFYLRATLDPLDAMPASDPRWRAALTALATEHGVGELHRWLRALDPARAERIDRADRQRLLRSLEVVLRSGIPTGERKPDGRAPAPAPRATIGLRWPREALTRRIEERVDRMIADGWVAEVQGLLDAGVPASAHALQAIGYRDLVSYLRGELSLAQARCAIVAATRRYAKRQMTWFRARPEISWIDLPLAGGLDELIERSERVIDAGGGVAGR